MKRIFHISNRVDIPEPGAATVGGLDEAISAAPEGYEIVRFGWSGHVVPDDEYDENKAVKITVHGDTTYITYDMKYSDKEGFYDGTANAFLWQVFHHRADLGNIGFDKEHNAIYERVNKDVAERAAKFIKDEDVVMVHDYHFMLYGKYSKTKNPIGFFLHIPTPDSDLIESIEDRDQQNYVYSLANALFHYDFVGLQSPRDLVGLNGLIGTSAAYTPPSLFQTGSLRPTPNENGIVTQFGVFPVAGNYSKYAEMAKSWETRRETQDFIRRHLPNGQVDLISTDRLDPSKGLVAKAFGVGRFLADFGKEDKLHLLQIAPMGREKVEAYIRERIEVITAYKGLNEMFGSVATLYMNKVERPLHLALARHSNAALITPLRDGFNLYIGEYLRAQEGRDNPGVAIASRFAGAASMLNGALITVDPRRPESIMAGIEKSRRLGPAQRQDMLGQALEIQDRYPNDQWQKSLIEATVDASCRLRR